jgi:outer membrane lipoprotein-sorting protein
LWLVAYAAAPTAAVWPYDAKPSLSADELLARVTAKYEKLSDFRARVAVVTTSAALGDTSESAGTLYARMPNLLRVEFVEPFAQTVVFDGRFMYVYIEGGDQVIRYAGSDVAYLVDLPGTLENLSADYDVELVAETGARAFELHLTAQKPSAVFRTIRFWIDRQKLLALRADFYDKAGNSTSYRLSDYRLNVGLSPDLFTLDVPAGVEVVDVAGPYGP